MGLLEDHFRPHVKDFEALLTHEYSHVRAGATLALGALHEYSEDPVALLGHRLEDSEVDVRLAAVQALGGMGELAKEQAPALAQRLIHDQSDVRLAAVRALAAMGKYAKNHLSEIATSLNDDDSEVQIAAADALGMMGEHAKDQAPLLAELLNNDDEDIQIAALRALEKLAEHAVPYASHIIPLLGSSQSVRKVARSTMRGLGPISVKLIPSLLVHRYHQTSRTGEIRFLAHVLGGGQEDQEILLAWIGGSSATPSDLMMSELHSARKILSIFQIAWEASVGYDLLRQDTANKVASIVDNGDWNTDDYKSLEWFENQFMADRDRFGSPAFTIQQRFETLRSVESTPIPLFVLAGHVAFWMVLIFAYPRYPQIQAIFFWNRWIRMVGGLGYVSFLITWVPFLRRRLLSPFSETLLADAHIDEFDEGAYFHHSLVRLPNGDVEPITTAMSSIHGQIILLGESGLGKSMYLRCLSKQRKHLTVFLLATDCSGGVLEAIRARVLGPASDLNFLQTLIYAGALDILIDGLNEASPNTRATITEFAKRTARGNLVLATQPMVWEPPPRSKTYAVQGLRDEQIEEFLVSRFTTLDTGERITLEEYTAHCHSFVGDVLGRPSSSEGSDAVRRVMSNPMDLTVVAQMLMNGEEPNLFLITTQAKRNLSSRSGIGGVRSAT